LLHGLVPTMRDIVENDEYFKGLLGGPRLEVMG
jgi:hypothetical protein